MKFGGLLFTLMLAACATTNFATDTRGGVEQSIDGSPVYIYSMLDVRQQEFGAAMITEVNNQLVQQLRQHNVASEVVSFRDTTVGMSFALKGSAYIPIGEVIASRQ